MSLGLVQKFRNCDFNLENILVQLNKNKKSKPSDWPDAVWRLYVILEMNNSSTQMFASVLQNHCSKSITKFPEKKSSQCSAILTTFF